MPTFADSTEVEAPQAWLFDVMQRYDRRLEWDEFLSEARLVAGAERAGVGVRAWCVDLAGRGVETEYVSFAPPSKVAVRMTAGPWMFHAFAGSWGYEALGPERTRVTFRYHVEASPRWLGAVADAVLARVFASEMHGRLASAKRRLEAMWRAEAPR